VYKVGDKIMIDDPKIVLEKTDALCTHALSSLLHYVLVLSGELTPSSWGCQSQRTRNTLIFNV